MVATWLHMISNVSVIECDPDAWMQAIDSTYVVASANEFRVTNLGFTSHVFIIGFTIL